MKTLRVKLTVGIKWLGWLDIAFFGLCAFFSWRDEFPAWPVFIFFASGGALLLFIDGSVEMNEQFIRNTMLLFGRWQMNWDEIERIEIQPGHGGMGDMVLHGQDKRLAIPGINLWSGESKEQMIKLFNSQIETLGITKETTVRAGLQLSKNTRLRR